MPSKRIFLVLSLLALTALVMGAFFLFDWPSVLDSSSRPETGWEERRHRYAVDRSTYTSQRGEEERYGFPLNINVEHVAAKDAPLEDGELVLGVVINHETRAYPVNYMMGPANEIVNDTLGGKAIAPTW